MSTASQNGSLHFSKKFNLRQHLSKMHAGHLPTNVFWWPPLGVITSGWGGGLGPQVNKFEQESSDDHQMSVAGW